MQCLEARKDVAVVTYLALKTSQLNDNNVVTVYVHTAICITGRRKVQKRRTTVLEEEEEEEEEEKENRLQFWKLGASPDHSN